MMLRAGIIGTGSEIPERIVTNEEIAGWPGIDTTPEWIEQHTGITERRFAAPGETTSMYAVKAAQKALKNSGLSAAEIGLIIVATTTPDYNCPATATTVQHLLGAECPAMDLKAGCSGFGYGLATADAFVKTGVYQNILVVGADLLSRITNMADRGTCILLGDAAGAVVISPVEDDFGIMASILGSDGSQARSLFIPDDGEAAQLTAAGKVAAAGKLYMDGHSVFRFAKRIMADTIQELAAKVGLELEEIDLNVTHQANLRIIEAAAKQLKVSPKNFFVNLQNYGNTSAASIPLALDEAVNSTMIRREEWITTVAFGAGLTWAGSIMRWVYNR